MTKSNRSASTGAFSARAADRHLRTVDPILGAAMTTLDRLDLAPRRLEPYQSLVRSVVYQQLSGKAAATILGRVTGLFPGVSFPSPGALAAMSEDRLRAAGLSRQKLRYIRDIAARAVDGTIPDLAACDRMADEELMERLTTIYGVGRWTVEMMLIFNLGRPDVLPVHDLGVRKGFARIYKKRGLPEPKRLEAYGERWRPYRTAAAWYLWRAADGEDATG